MNKFTLIGLSLLVLIMACGFACASHADDSLQAVDDKGNIDEIICDSDADIQHDASNQAIPDHADDSQIEISDSASADLQTQQDTGSDADPAPHSQTNDDIKLNFKKSFP